jgi:hypothetical protein
LDLTLSQIYRIILPKFIRKKIDSRRLKARIFDYYSKLTEPLAEDIEAALEYLRTRPLVMFPHYFQDHYKSDRVEVFYDHENKLPYALLDMKKLYFKRRLSKRRIQKIFNELLKEQDTQSPHCYETINFKVENKDVLVDIGAAEGNFSLSVVEKASRIIIFEGDKEWIEPLKATFSPWKNKVTIVNKFVGDTVDSNFTTLDDYFSDTDKISFLKIDVEGAESQLLNGCKRILQSQIPLKIAICTYHKPEDELEFNSLLRHHRFETTHSDGYVLLYRDRNIKAPFFRRGMIRAIRN